ncbi:MAG: transporter [Opitutae bacterium]|nr:transporter [Opitutae bacterium]
MLSFYDYLVIGVYFLFMLVIGAIFHRSNKSTSDFFRGGGQVLWWIVGATAFMTQFSAWTFTGASSKAYENGAIVLTIYFANALGFFVNYAGTASRLRQMRIITTLEGIRQRWGGGNEQFFTWIAVPIGILSAGIALNGLGVILSSVFGFNISTTMLIAGILVIFMATFGGSWAATAGDFMQMLVLVAVTCVAAFLALYQVGGVSEFIGRLPEQSFTWGQLARPEIIYLWMFAQTIKQLIVINNMTDGYRYLCAKDDRHARRGALLAAILFVIGPIVWFIPPMAARILYPDLSVIPALQPLGAKITEGAYLAVGIMTMPQGMIGLMVTSLFAATISNMDTGLNKNTGIFIRSFYRRTLRPHADERELMIASKIVTVVFGTMTVLAAFMFNSMEGLSLFNLMQQFTSLVAVPIAIPLLWGMFYRRTPSWSGWSTVVVCLGTSLIVGNLTTFFGPNAYQRLLLLATPIATWERPDVLFLLGVLGNTIVGSVWFLGTSFWYKQEPPEFHAKVDAFFEKMKTPIDFAAEHGKSADRSQFRTLGTLCLAYGGFVLLLALIPNGWVGRLCFIFIGGAIGGIGALLFRAARKAT